ncbi:GD16100 [Drosophila simulans]|uniref:GD16100 n=1 Tax=Drosophila simulans TaxID=7240 RepID=B4R6K8_DROSI|nr:GD16100 [Drosophila simulans]
MDEPTVNLLAPIPSTQSALATPPPTTPYVMCAAFRYFFFRSLYTRPRSSALASKCSAGDSSAARGGGGDVDVVVATAPLGARVSEKFSMPAPPTTDACSSSSDPRIG